MIIGWFAAGASAYFVATIGARRQTVAALINDVADRAESLRDQAVQYYTVEQNQPMRRTVAAQIRLGLQSLASCAATLNSLRPKRYSVASETIAFRRAITGGNFEHGAETFVPLDPGSETIEEIWLAYDALVAALRKK